MKKDLIYNPQDNEQKLFGIQPKNQLAYRLYVIFRWVFLGSIFFSVLSFLSISFIKLSDEVKTYVIYGIMGLLVFGLAALFLGLMTRILFLRKAPFDDWILDIAEKTLGTKVILYSSKTIYIQYDRNNKEVDKKEFIQKMTERSERYSYFLVKTHIDEGFLEVACTARQPIPTMALKKEEDDTLFNVVPLGLALNNVTKKISPVGWVINTENKNENMIETLPAISLAIVGTSGCHGKNDIIKLQGSVVTNIDELDDIEGDICE